MNMSCEDKYIKDVLNRIHTPAYDPTDDVMRRLQSAPRKNIALRRVLVVALILCLVAAALGAAKLLIARTVNFDGEITQFEYQPNPITPTATPETEPENIYVDEEHEFTSAAQPGELRVVIDNADNSSLSNIPHIAITDINTAMEYAANSVIPLSFPQYIPEGYTLREGGISFFESEESINAELIYSETKDNKLYETYILPEGYEKNIQGIWLEYADSEGHRLRYSIHAWWFEDKNDFSYNLTDGKTAQVYVPEGFDEGLLIHDSSDNAYSLNSAYLYKEIEPVTSIYNFSGMMHPETMPEKFNTDEYKYEIFTALTYNLSGEVLNEEEIKKIAESIN
jgi:hypothetical protein